jgi:DNA-directed RNA polymerase specialized sigma24 family protein
MYKTLLHRLTHRQRRAWKLHLECDLDPAAIAANMGITQSAVSKLLARARERLGGPYRVARHRQPQARSMRPISLSTVFNA